MFGEVQYCENANEVPARSLIFLKGFEAIAINRLFRKRVLDVFEYLVNETDHYVVVVSDVAPLFRLTRQIDYPGTKNYNESADAFEVIRWSNLMNRFIKLYWWTVIEKDMLNYPATPFQTLMYESRGWPELQQVKSEFWKYHATQMMNSEVIGKSDNYYQKELRKAEEQINEKWINDRILEFFSSNAGATYRYRWELCTKAERLFMFQIAKGMEPNPLNIELLEHLMRRGFILRDKGWHLINDSFKRFVLTAEHPETIKTWIEEAKESAWRYLRIPLFVLVITLVSIMVYVATDAVESAIGVLAGILGIIPLAIKNISMFRGGTPPS